jgi:hypothetical protein
VTNADAGDERLCAGALEPPRFADPSGTVRPTPQLDQMPVSDMFKNATEEEGEWIVTCGHCSLRLDEAPDAELGTRPPCPECDSWARAIRWTGPSGAHIMLREWPRKRPGEKRPRFEKWLGDSLSTATGRWMRLTRIIDRENDRYYEYRPSRSF